MRRFSAYSISLLLVLISYTAYTQVIGKRDSLLNLIDKETQDTSIVNLNGKLAAYYLKSNADSALYFAKRGLYLAERRGFEFLTGRMYRYIGHAMVVKDSLELAKENYLKALYYFKQSNKLVSMSGIYLVLGNIFYVQDNFPEALNSYILGERIADSLNNLDLLPDFYNNLAGIYLQLEDYQKSLKYFQNALKISELNDDTETSVNILNNMARVYYSINDYENAKQKIELSLNLAKSLPKNEVYIIHSLLVKGELELKLMNYQSALKLFENSLDNINELDPGYLGPIAVDKAGCLTYIGKCYLELGSYAKAKESLAKGYKLAKEIGLIGKQKSAVLYLSQVYDSLGNTNKAFSYYKEYKLLSDSLSNENTTKKITHLKLQFEFDKKIKEQELEQARKETIQKRKEFYLYLIIAGVLLGLIIFLLLYFLQKSKIKRVHLERENLQLDLESRNKELTTNVMYLLKKNEFIESISDKLKKTKLYFKPENRSFVDNIIKELEASLSQDAWEEFEIRFQQVHKDFYNKLNERYPDLTPNELKLCAFLRLNMSTKEISSITYQSDKSIFTARYRLRKKLGLDEHASLITFLSGL